MANAATQKTALPISIWGATAVIPIETTWDTTATDLTIYTPSVTGSTGNMVAIVGWLYGETTAHTWTFTDGSDAQATIELGANSGASQGIGATLLFVTAPGNALKAQTSVAITGSVLFYLIEGPRFRNIT